MCQTTQAGECLICANCDSPIVGDVFYFFGQPMDEGCAATLNAEYDEQFDEDEFELDDLEEYVEDEDYDEDDVFVDYDDLYGDDGRYDDDPLA